MTRKHFIALARALNETHASIETVQAIANVCAYHNENFDRGKFLDAAGRPIAASGWRTLNQ